MVERPDVDRVTEIREANAEIDEADLDSADRAIRELLLEVDARGAETEEARDWVRRLTAAERLLTCAFCGEAYPPGTPTDNHEALTAHVRVCAKHPMREVERERDEMRKLLSRIRVELLATGALSEYSTRSIAREIDAALAAGVRR